MYHGKKIGYHHVIVKNGVEMTSSLINTPANHKEILYDHKETLDNRKEMLYDHKETLDNHKEMIYDHKEMKDNLVFTIFVWLF